jgi:hypothetical protein
VVFCQYQTTDALNKIQFMTGIETPTCFGTVATSSVAFFVGTASGRQPAIEDVLPPDLTLSDAVSWLADNLSSLRNLVQLLCNKTNYMHQFHKFILA